MIPVERGIGAFCVLVTAGVLSSLLSIWVFRRFSDAAKLGAAVNRALAHLLEFRLFGDEPALVLRAQGQLLAAVVKTLRYTARPSLILFLPFALIFIAAAALFEHAALVRGEQAVVTVRCSKKSAVRLKAPPEIRIETPPVHIPRQREISWRIRPVDALSARLQFETNGHSVYKTIVSGPGLHWLSEERTRPARFLFRPFELPFRDTALESITVRYPPALVFHHHWLVWFFAGSLAGAATYWLFTR